MSNSLDYHPVLMSQFDGLVVERRRVFTLDDGTVVIQWDDHRIQELVTGLYRDFDHKRDFGHAITDYELAQLRMSDRIEYYNRQHVWLYPLPEAGRFGQRRVHGRQKAARAYYLKTDLSLDDLDNVQGLLADLRLGRNYTARVENQNIVLVGANGQPYSVLEEAVFARRVISDTVPGVFDNLAIAYVEKNVEAPMSNNETPQKPDNHPDGNSAGKLVIMALSNDDERQAFADLLTDMHLQVRYTASAFEALELLEDYTAQLFIMDIQLPDMHGWTLLNKIKEIEQIRNLPVLVISDQSDIGNTVAKVDYLVRPVSIARLRQSVSSVVLEN